MRGFILAFAVLGIASSATAQVHVRGYTRSDGTYVAPYERTAPDHSLYNNYSTSPNVNPYTGKVGTVNPYAPSTTPHSYGYETPKAPCYGYCPH